jgi:hypothetical protein
MTKMQNHLRITFNIEMIEIGGSSKFQAQKDPQKLHWNFGRGSNYCTQLLGYGFPVVGFPQFPIVTDLSRLFDIGRF